ncbi:MAG: hypothetical protein VB034_09775 [Eubacteriales bacterium]|nr:hypothetical protein [Eubacteriales bacterium]
MKLIVFDIGSNTIRSAKVTEGDDGLPFVSHKRVYTTRLAEGLAESGNLSQARMLQSLLVIRSVCAEGFEQGFQMYAYATSAVRDAKNGRAFIDDVESILGIGHTAILSGKEEAAFAQQGADPSGTRTIIDIGGGSTQVIRPGFRESWPIGCVRAKDLAPFTDLPEISDSLRPILSGLFGTPALDERPDKPSLPDEKKKRTADLLGVGGTITTLALLCDGQSNFVPWTGEKRIEHLDLVFTLQQLSQMSETERSEIPLLKERYDVILHGGVILLYLMERLHNTRIGATLSDGLDGYGTYLFQQLKHKP